MTEFEEFIEVATKMGTGRMVGTERQIPVFVPEGNFQDILLDKTIEYLVQLGFVVMNVTNGEYREAVEVFPLSWPFLLEKWPGTDDFEANIGENENKVLIVCGKTSNRLFWKYLCQESLFYTGGGITSD